MDNPSENISETEQKPPETDKAAYQQYLDSDTQKSAKHQKKKIIFIAAGVLALFVIIIIVALVFGKKDDPAQQAQTAFTTCADESCFSDHFTNCLPAVYTHQEADSNARYELDGPGEVGCSMEFEYISGGNIKDAAGKEMMCDFDNRLDFKTATQNVLRFPQDYDCVGDLADLLIAQNPPTEAN